MAAKKRRADELLWEKLNLETIELARALIMEGRALSDNQRITGPAQMLKIESELRVKGNLDSYVSRGAHKLKRALEFFGIDLSGQICVDVGASTGGFTDVLLQNGAAHVYAIDVGYGQLDWKIRSDERVTVLERTNARYLTHEQIPCIPEITVMDVSFISVKLILPVAAELMERKGRFCILIKPQFEAGREHVGKKGVVRDPDVHRQVIEEIAAFAPSIGYAMAQLDFSPITGPEGNIEYITELLPEAIAETRVDSLRIAAVVEQAHQTLAK